jgi:ABC-type uncharacterized transport system substrate-binding protein
MMDRRAFLGILALLAAPRAAEAQRSVMIPRVGVIGERSQTDPFLEAFREGLRARGYVDGRGLALEYRYALGALDRIPALAAELARLPVDLLVVGGTVSAQAAKRVAPTVPIVFVTSGDPVASGLVASLSRPGGNVTGLSIVAPEMIAKQLELLKTVVPKLSRATVLYNSGNPGVKPAMVAAREAGRTLAIEVHVLEIRRRSEVAGAASLLSSTRAGALLIISDPVFGNELPQLSRLAADHRLPAIYTRKEFAEAGGLMSYGPSFADNYRRAAVYVDKILKGAKPADLPVEQPTTFELVINLKTAKALGLTIPPSLMQRADQVIE